MPTEEINQIPDTTIDPVEQAPAEQTEQVEQQAVAPADTKASDDAAFEQGFNTAQGGEEPAPEPDPEPELAYTPEQVKELIETVSALKGREAKVFGTMGALKQQIDALKSQQAPPQREIKLMAHKFKRLVVRFPELAKLISEDLTEALQGETVADNGQATQLFEQLKSKGEELELKSKKIEAQLLTAAHPDWRKVVATPEFTAWKATLTEQDRNEFDESWDSEYLAAKIAEHKDWKSKAVQQKQSNQRRLETAITPRARSPRRHPRPMTPLFKASERRGGLVNST